MNPEDSIPPSGLNYPNNLGRLTVEAMQKVVGKETFQGIAREAHLSQYIDQLPPNNLRRQFDFAHFAALMDGIDRSPANRGNPSALAAEIGRESFRTGNKIFSSLSALGPIWLGFRTLSMNVRIKYGLIALSVVFTTLSDQFTEVEEHPDHFAYVIHRCPICWGRQSDHPICAMAGGVLEEGLYWATESHFTVTESSCCACGDSSCTFVIPKVPDSR